MSRLNLLWALILMFIMHANYAQTKSDLSKTVVKEGVWYGEFIYNSGMTFPVTFEVTKSKKGKFSAQMYWFNYFNTKCHIEGDLTKDVPEFHETKLVHGKAMNFGDYFMESVKNDTLIAYSTNDDTNLKDASILLVHEDKVAKDVKEKYTKDIAASVERYGTQKFSLIKDDKLQKEVLDKIKNAAESDTLFGKTFKVEGTIAQDTQFSGSMTAYFQLPDYHMMKMEIMEFEVYTGMNKENIWNYSSIEKSLKLEEITDESKKDNSNSNIFKSQLFALIDSGFTIRNFGEAVIDGEECYRIVVEKGMNYQGYYYSKDNFHTVQKENENAITTIKVEILKGGYVPRSYTQLSMNSKFIMTFDKFNFNIDMDTTLFYPTEEMLATKKESIEDHRKGADYFNDLGISFYEKGEFEKAIAEFDNAINNSVPNPTYFANRGRAHLELENYYDAISDFNQSIQYNKEKKSTYYYLGLAKYNLKDFKSAAKDFKTSLEIDSTKIGRLQYNYLALSLYNLNELDSAYYYFKKCTEHPNAIAMDYYNYGYLLRKDNKDTEALPYFKKTVELEQENHAYINHYGVALFRVGNYEDALVQFSKATEMEAEALTYKDNLGNTYMRLGEHDKALSLFLVIEKKLDEPNDNIMNKIGQCYHSEGDYIKAMNYYNKSIELNSTNAEYYDYRAYLKKINNDKKGAIQDFTTSINIYNKDPEIYYQRGLIQQDLHNKQSACEDFNKAAELGHEKAAGLVSENCNYKEQ
ncbi:tetratricopeptide repeat protein [Flammeovirga sp. MY04]|uniref:tetratricopeptide repeat protein n=1 Tax=Flammeovirga sp. MY04 TaxID=1191459 RepID=UPI000825A4B6|nr:tetratricopeptide repeat protein [Flammeovirga sp. MY04]ANQ49024.2 tetratricopeptide repeat protein [Flammeovirga sp. MY04]